MTKEEKTAAKLEIMARVGEHYAKIQVGKTALAELEATAKPDIHDAAMLFGAGPHKMPLPGRPNMIVTFRREGDSFRMSAQDIDKLT